MIMNIGKKAAKKWDRSRAKKKKNLANIWTIKKEMDECLFTLTASLGLKDSESFRKHPMVQRQLLQVKPRSLPPAWYGSRTASMSFIWPLNLTAGAQAPDFFNPGTSTSGNCRHLDKKVQSRVSHSHNSILYTNFRESQWAGTWSQCVVGFGKIPSASHKIKSPENLSKSPESHRYHFISPYLLSNNFKYNSSYHHDHSSCHYDHSSYYTDPYQVVSKR